MQDQIDRPTTALWVTVGTDSPSRLEQHDVDVSTTFSDHPPFSHNPVIIRIHPGRQFGDDLTIDGDHPRFNQGFTSPTGCNPGLSQYFLQTRTATLVAVSVSLLFSSSRHSYHSKQVRGFRP